MSMAFILIKRNIRLFFKDKGMFFTSLITPAICIHHVRHGLLVNVHACGVMDAIALRRGDGPAQMNVELRTSVLCAKNILIAAVGQGVVHNKAAVLRLCFVGDLEQIVEVCTRFYEQALLAPVVGAVRGDELFGVDRLGGDDGGVRVAIGDLVISLAMIVEIIDILGTTGLVLVFLKVVAHGVYVVPYFAWVRILIDGHAKIDIRIRRVNIQRFFRFSAFRWKITAVRPELW